MSIDDRKALEAFLLDNPELEKLEALLAQFNIFEAIGAVRQERRHSDFLAFLLDPQQNHGLGDIFLKRLLITALSQADNAPFSLVEIDVTDFDHASVVREWRNIDILVVNDAAQIAVVIENKIGSSEHSNQLTRYRSAIQQQYPRYRTIYIFLTPEGILSADDEDRQFYISLSYGTVANILESIVDARSSTIGADVATLIRHYVVMLRRHIVTDSEIDELCRKIYSRHKQALDLIYEYRPDTDQPIIDYLGSLLDESQWLKLGVWTKWRMYFVPYVWDILPAFKCGEVWAGGGHLFRFRFALERNGRLILRLVMNTGPESILNPVREVLEKHSIFKSIGPALQGARSIYSHRILKVNTDEEPELEVVKPVISQSWQHFLSHDLPTIRDMIENKIPWSDLEAQLKTSSELK